MATLARRPPLLQLAAVVIIILGLKAAGPVLVPLALALVVSAVNLPLLSWLGRRRVPLPFAIALVLVVTFLALAVFATVATAALADLRVALPHYIHRIQTTEASVVAALAERGFELPPTPLTSYSNPQQLLDLTAFLLRGIAGLMTSTFLVLLITIFILAEAADMPSKLQHATGWDDRRMRRIGRLVTEVQRYLVIKTAVSLVTGVAVGLWTWMVGVDFPVFWGLLAFVLNFVPTIGSVVAAIPAIIVAGAQLGLGPAVLVMSGYLAINIIFGNLIEPHLVGQKLGISTLVVVVSLIFWGWVWGPAGMLLAVPLTMIARILAEHSRGYGWAAALIDSKPASSAATSHGGVNGPPGAAA